MELFAQLLPLLILIGIFIGLGVFLKKSSSQVSTSMSRMDESMKLMRESNALQAKNNELLSEIKVILEKR